ncbi:gustatory receptor for sugar taste 64b-like [Musca domestica]|uniref:Gustatory receptor n=1 Tax=Musca domestica TaxID=7370 RepID=A0ABM3UQJ0_MUSDO|nr:gustatory receptor for sugar taste 64b-like [Musca domestica]
MFDDFLLFLFISQIFALFPISNVYHGSIARLRYKWLSLPVAYASAIMILNFLEFVVVIYYNFVTGINFHSLSTIALFLVCLLEHYFFWRLSSKWPKLMKQWRQAEEVFFRTPYPNYLTFNMKFWLWLWYTVIMCGGLMEHCLLVFNFFQNADLERTQCNLNVSNWEILYYRERPHLRLVIPFQYWMLPLLEWLDLTLAYPRNFTDAFIALVSVGLATRFRQIYLRIRHVQGKPMPSIFWLETREHYLMLKKLLRDLNKEMSVLIFLSGANNMYFICCQLFNSFTNIGVDWVAEMAFWYSLLYNIFRTILTFSLASMLDEYTRKIIICLRDVPSRSWCTETQRFSQQLAVDVTAFTAAGLFTLTRKLILAMASTVVTYQLMVSNVINEGAIKQETNYCKHYERFEETFAAAAGDNGEQIS